MNTRVMQLSSLNEHRLTHDKHFRSDLLLEYTYEWEWGDLDPLQHTCWSYFKDIPWA